MGLPIYAQNRRFPEAVIYCYFQKQKHNNYANNSALK